MSTEKSRYTPPDHDLTRANYSPHATNDGSPLVFDSRCRRCWYEKAKTEDLDVIAQANLCKVVAALLKAIWTFAERYPYVGLADAHGYPEGKGLRVKLNRAIAVGTRRSRSRHSQRMGR